ncbi:MAG: hypothetical protein Q4P15_13885, partial [Propionibacteriaceae bacterium]|nr:hypothetical protein [Propionibacteriaceae bacterium]
MSQKLDRRREVEASVRGIQGEDAEHLSGAQNKLLRKRSMRLLGSLLYPERWRVTEVAAATVVGTSARVAVPALVGLGVDAGFGALGGKPWTSFVVIAVLTLVCAVVAGIMEGHAKAVTPR